MCIIVVVVSVSMLYMYTYVIITIVWAACGCIFWVRGRLHICMCITMHVNITSAARSRAVGGEPTEGERWEEEGEAVYLLVYLLFLVSKVPLVG